MKLQPQKFKNGLSVILVPQTGASSMTLLVLVKVGSRYEMREINGASHFIEHLMFKGTRRRPNTQIISRELDRYGAEYNAYTDKDVTGYYIKMDAQHTLLAVDILHDMLFHSLYAPTEINRERGVIIEEINMYEDNPRAHIEDLLERALFPNSTLGWNIAGTREIIRNVTREQLIRYRDAYYTPERMTIVVAGRLMPGLRQLLEKTFGSVKRRGGQDASFDAFCPPASLRQTCGYQEKHTEQTQVALAFHGLNLGHADLPAVSLLATMLGGSMSSRLFIQVRERRGLCYSVGAGHQAREDTGLFSITAGLAKARLREALRVIFNELDKVVNIKVTTEELRRAKDHINGRTRLAFENSAMQAEWYGKQWLFQGLVETPDEKLKRFERVTAEDVRRVAKNIFRKDRLATALIGTFGRFNTARKLLTWK